MAETAIPLARAWNSWDCDRPAAMRFLPLGLSLIPAAYAASRNAFTLFPPGPGVVPGRRGIGADGVSLTLAHAGTEIALTYALADPWTLCGRWRVLKSGEWGLRFWLCLALRLAPPEADGEEVPWRFDRDSGLVHASWRSVEVAVGCDQPPLLVTFHDSLADLAREFERHGYWYLASRDASGPLAVLRTNLEEMPEFAFAAAVADAPEAAAASVRRALDRAEGLAPAAPQAAHSTATSQSALDAVRDVIAWNTVWDPVNRRPYTSLSRNWSMQKFGGWGVWLDDVLLHALMAGLVDAGLAKENLLAALANARPAGNLACLLTGHDRWVDRSQPPIGAFVVWLLHRRLGDRSILEDAYPVLARNHAWWLATRDGNGDGLYEYGTSAVGAGLYVGTKLAAKDESFMDNSPVHDEARLDPASRTLDAADVGLNSLIALDGEMLALIAAALGDGEAARRYQEEAAGLKARIAERLWDAGRGVFANRRWSGAFVRSLAPTSFFPLLAGAARTEQAQAMREWLRDPGTFGGAWPLPSVTRDDPAFADNVYWRGRIWPPLHFLVWYGLKRYGFAAEAAMLAQSGWRLFERAWAGRKCPENYNAVTGEALDQPDTDDFYGWGALMPFMAVGLAVDVTPWHGWELNAQAGEGRIGPIRSPWGGLVLDVAGGTMTVEIDRRPVLRTSLKLLTGVEFAAGLVKAALPRSGGGDWIRLPGIGPADLHAALLDGRPLAARFEGGDAVLALPECAHPAQFAALLGGARP